MMDICMTFPESVEEFMESYKVVDSEHIYSNGIEFVPIFRMKQWFEHLPSAQLEWIPVTDRLPEVGKKVLVFAYGNDTLTARMQKQTENGYPVFECNGIFLEMAKLGRITHWMPLPNPPKVVRL